jgi:hypothetical protein
MRRHVALVPAVLICLLALGAALRASTPAPDPDVLVYGGTPGGIAAAVAAAKAGRTVLLVEPARRVGGLVTNGLSYSDFRSFESLTGFFLEFAQRVEADYRARYGADSAQVKDSWRGTHGEPSVNQRVFDAMLAERGVRVLREHRLGTVERSDYVLGRRRLVAATFHGPGGASVRCSAKQFIDGTYEGDLLAAAGESFHVGRESREQYGEPLAGNAQGQADGQVQGYNFRLIMTTRADNRIMPAAPAGYRREDFVGALAPFRSGRLTRVFAAGREGVFRAHEPILPNDKYDVNDTPKSPIRLSLPDLNDAYPEADATLRAQIVQRHRYENIGLLYFLQNDPEVPASIREEARRWGFCRDEFTDNGGMPEQLYVREARRLVGQHVFTIKDTRLAARDARAVLHRESIAIGDYVHNCHGTGRRGTRYDGEHEGEFYDFVQPYQIRYGVIVPQRTENLLVPVACSASHFGFSALRLEPIWAALGQAAGWAAHLALETGRPVQQVDVAKLQRALHDDRSATIYVGDVPPESPAFAAVQWFGTQGAFHGLVDVAQPAAPERLAGQYVKAFPGHAAELDAPMTAALAEKWQALLPKGVAAPTSALTRGEWLRAAFAALPR